MNPLQLIPHLSDALLLGQKILDKLDTLDEILVELRISNDLQAEALADQGLPEVKQLVAALRGGKP